MQKMLRLVLFICTFFILSCGYKPVSKITNNVLGEKIYASVYISLTDPLNTVILQDALKDAIISRFNASLSSKDEANTIINASILSVEFVPLIYDRNGYVTSYKTKVIVRINTTFQNKSKDQYNASGEYDFPIQANSVISDANRYLAIKQASLDALDEYIAYIAIKGMKWQAQ